MSDPGKLMHRSPQVQSKRGNSMLELLNLVKIKESTISTQPIQLLQETSYVKGLLNTHSIVEPELSVNFSSSTCLEKIGKFVALPEHYSVCSA